MLNFIVPEIDSISHYIYVEPFGGGASIFLNKKPSPVEVYNDLDGGLVNFFMVLADEEKYQKFHRIVSVLPYSRELYKKYKAEWEREEDEVWRAAKWFIVARQSFSGSFGQSWSYIVKSSSRGMAASVSRYLSAISLLPEIHARLQRVQIDHSDWREILNRYDTPETLFYLDPPYILDTRVGGKAYKHELTEEDHRELVERLLKLQGSWVLSGYDHPIYNPLSEASKVKKKSIDIGCSAVGRIKGSGFQGAGSVMANEQYRTETLWICNKAERMEQAHFMTLASD